MSKKELVLTPGRLLTELNKFDVNTSELFMLGGSLFAKIGEERPIEIMPKNDVSNTILLLMNNIGVIRRALIDSDSLQNNPFDLDVNETDILHTLGYIDFSGNSPLVADSVTEVKVSVKTPKRKKRK